MRHPVTLAHVKAQSYLMYSRNLSSLILIFTENVYCTINQGLLYLDGRNSQKYLHQDQAYFYTLIMLHILTQTL